MRNADIEKDFREFEAHLDWHYKSQSDCFARFKPKAVESDQKQPQGQ